MVRQGITPTPIRLDGKRSSSRGAARIKPTAGLGGEQDSVADLPVSLVNYQGQILPGY